MRDPAGPSRRVPGRALPLGQARREASPLTETIGLLYYGSEKNAELFDMNVAIYVIRVLLLLRRRE